MRNRLAVKLIVMLVAVLLLSGLISAFTISTTTRSAFEQLVRRSDVAAARFLAQRLGRFYAARGSWQGVENLLESSAFEMFLGRMHPGTRRMERRMPGGMFREDQEAEPGEGMPHHGNEHGAPPPVTFVLTNADGDVIAHTLPASPEDSLEKGELRRGEAVSLRGETVGYVLLGSMVNPILGPFQREFLHSMYRAIALSTLLAVLLGAVAGYVFIRSITVPLGVLSRAAGDVTEGRYQAVLPVERRDEIGDLSRSFLSMVRSLGEADAWKKKIIADSAHELRTPVSVLQGNIEMMLEGVYPIDRQRIEGLQEETELLSRLLEELQMLAKAEEGRGRYRFEETDAGELLQLVYTSAAPLASSARLNFKLAIPEEPLPLIADRQKLLQAVTNLVNNAIRYTPPEGRVELSAGRLDAGIQISVEDTGPGIPRAEREQVFERFYRLDKARNRQSGGSGLGLAIVREIALAHGGRAEISDPLRLSGTRALLYLPAGGPQAAGGE